MSDKLTVYLETTIPSYLTARHSNNLIATAKKEITMQWWEKRKDKYDLFISDFVIEEASKGDPEASRLRLDAIGNFPLLSTDMETIELTESIMTSGLLPLKAATDAAHIAIATKHNIDFLLTWNCTHIANAEILPRIKTLISNLGYELPTICIPDELFGEDKIT